MSRRTFVKNTALCAVAVSTSGFIYFDGKKYVGDCETTTDIIGPFYRPNSPVRNNLVVPGAPGDLVELNGVIYHSDCMTPYKNAKIELWHCSAKGVYDNESAEFLYRGTSFSDQYGKYSFQTVLPVPYDIGGGNSRPAHFHMMISAEGYVPLVTQLYFTGDPYIDKDPSSSSPNAKRRILDVQHQLDGTKNVIYNVGMSETLPVESAALDKLTGEYINEKDAKNKIEFFKRDGTLWVKNDLFGNNLDYIGNNTFKSGGEPAEDGGLLKFEIMKKGSVKLSIAYKNDKGEKVEAVYMKGK